MSLRTGFITKYLIAGYNWNIAFFMQLVFKWMYGEFVIYEWLYTVKLISCSFFVLCLGRLSTSWHSLIVFTAAEGTLWLIGWIKNSQVEWNGKGENVKCHVSKKVKKMHFLLLSLSHQSPLHYCYRRTKSFWVCHSFSFMFFKYAPKWWIWYYIMMKMKINWKLVYFFVLCLLFLFRHALHFFSNFSFSPVKIIHLLLLTRARINNVEKTSFQHSFTYFT